jgi:CheY-like chemotaxis protein
LHFVGARAGLAGCGRIALLATGFEALLFELIVKPSLATPSTLHTIAQAMDCLNLLFENTETGFAQVTLEAKVLVVDDDAVNNRVMLTGLKRANLDAESVADPRLALQKLQAGRYDLILLDILMPGMNGFELCEQLRRLPGYLDTPVIFVTAHDDFENRIQSVVSGGNDLIAKPVFPLELALKATTDLLRAQLKSGNATRGA